MNFSQKDSITTPLNTIEDEISLIDLALIVYLRRWWFILSFGLSAIIGVLIINKKTVPIINNSIYKVSSYAYGIPIEPLPLLYAKIEDLYIPKIMNEIKIKNKLINEKLQYELFPRKDSGNSEYIIFQTKVNKKSKLPIEQIHKSLLDTIQDEHKKIIQNREKVMEKEIERLNENIKLLENLNSMTAKEKLAMYIDQRSKMEIEKNSFREGEILEFNKNKEDEKSNLHFFAIMFVTSFIFSFFIVFFAEFIMNVRIALHTMRNK